MGFYEQGGGCMYVCTHQGIKPAAEERWRWELEQGHAELMLTRNRMSGSYLPFGMWTVEMAKRFQQANTKKCVALSTEVAHKS